jgi:hypothetical protein
VVRHPPGIQIRQHDKDDNVSPEDVDAYVDNALKYVDGPLADFLKSIKRNFGAAGNPPQGGQDQNLSAGAGNSDWMLLTGYSPDGGAFMPRLPTTEEISRWPSDMARQFFRWLDNLLQNNPLLIDPNALEGHHGLPRAFIKYFLDSGLSIEDFLIIMRAADHRLKPDGVHTGKGRGGNWNEEWREFMYEYPAENTQKHKDRVDKKFKEMKKKYGIQ